MTRSCTRIGPGWLNGVRQPPVFLYAALSLPSVAVALGIDYLREASCPQLGNERERTTQKDRRLEKAVVQCQIHDVATTREFPVVAKGDSVIHPLRMTVKETIGCEGRGNAINRCDWGSRSQTSIGPHSRAVGAQSRNVVRTYETLQDICRCFHA